jgi:hypothetical protein
MIWGILHRFIPTGSTYPAWDVQYRTCTEVHTVHYLQVAQYWWRWACEVLPRKAKRSDRRMLCHVRSRHDQASTTSHPLIPWCESDHDRFVPTTFAASQVRQGAQVPIHPSSCAARSGSARSFDLRFRRSRLSGFRWNAARGDRCHR